MSRYKSDGKKYNACPNCHRENNSDYGNAPGDRIRFLEKKIRVLEKEIESKTKSGVSTPQDEYFMSFKP